MKRIFFMMMALMSIAPVFAQDDDGEEPIIIKKEKSNAFFIGPKIGGTMTTMTQPNEGKLYDSSAFGLSGGLAMKMRFGKASENSPAGTGYFAAGLELKYRQSVVKTIGTDEDGKENANLSLSYFDVPVYVHVYPFAKSRGMNTLYIELGASFGGVLGRTPKSLTVTNPSAEYSSVTYNIDKDGSQLKGMDVRPLAGLGYTIPSTGLDINARYYIGTSNLAGNFPCKMSSLEISLSWMFNAAKF